MKKTLFVILVLACPSCWAMVEVEDAPFGQLDLFDYGFQPGAALLMEEEGNGDELAQWAMREAVSAPDAVNSNNALLSTEQKKAIAALHAASLVTVKKGMKKRKIARSKLWCKECKCRVINLKNFDLHKQSKGHLEKTGQPLPHWSAYEFTCAPCEYGAFLKQSLNAHMRSRSHLIKTGQLLPVWQAYKYRCEICKYGTPHKGNLNTHMQSKGHLEKTGQSLVWDAHRYRCEICERGFLEKGHFDRHMRTKKHEKSVTKKTIVRKK